MKAKFINADGGWQYRFIPNIQYTYSFPLIPKISLCVDGNQKNMVRKRTFEFYQVDEEKCAIYGEVIE